MGRSLLPPGIHSNAADSHGGRGLVAARGSRSRGWHKLRLSDLRHQSAHGTNPEAAPRKDHCLDWPAAQHCLRRHLWYPLAEDECMGMEVSRSCGENSKVQQSIVGFSFHLLIIVLPLSITVRPSFSMHTHSSFLRKEIKIQMKEMKDPTDKFSPLSVECQPHRLSFLFTEKPELFPLS